MTLDKYYRYWDEFVCEWKNFMSGGGNIVSWCHYTHLSQWLYPSFCNYIDKNNSSTPTIDYLPEPWWGNNGKHPLSAVVINLNPGKGGTSQTLLGLKSLSCYGDFINDNVSNYISNKNHISLWQTNNWHYINRAKPIFDAMTALGENVKGIDSLHNFLSIELLPWHTAHWNNVGNYPINNAKSIYNYSIKFAAKASMNIKNQLLGNCVLVRCPYSKFEAIFKYSKSIPPYEFIKPISSYVGVEKLDISKYTIIRFCDSEIENVKFVLIWQPNRLSQNNLPYCCDLPKILSTIKHY